MCSLNQFPPPPPVGHVTLCEVEGILVTDPEPVAVLDKYTNVVSGYPIIDAINDVHRVRVMDSSRLTLNTRQHMGGQLLRAWYTKGFVAAAELAVELSEQEGRTAHPWIGKIAEKVVVVSDWVARLRNSFTFLSMDSPTSLVATVCPTRSWQSACVRCMAWHPEYTSLAVAMANDTIHIYIVGKTPGPVLKHKNQKGVTCIAWRPNSPTDLAVGTLSGIIIWSVEGHRAPEKALGNSAFVLTENGHRPVTSLAWDRWGHFLVSASAADTSMYIWEVWTNKNVPLRRRGGGGVPLIAWADNSCRLFASTVGSTIRVWETVKWQYPERWSMPQGRVQAACWSPCGDHLLMALADEPIVFHLPFHNKVGADENNVLGSGDLAEPVALLEEIVVSRATGDERIGGTIQGMEWDPKGERLAITFKTTPFIAIFRTTTQPSFSITPSGLVRGYRDECPLTVKFQKNFSHGALLAIAWSSGRVQYLPFLFDNATSRPVTWNSISSSPSRRRTPIDLDTVLRQPTNGRSRSSGFLPKLFSP